MSLTARKDRNIHRPRYYSGAKSSRKIESEKTLQQEEETQQRIRKLIEQTQRYYSKATIAKRKSWRKFCESIESSESIESAPELSRLNEIFRFNPQFFSLGLLKASKRKLHRDNKQNS